MRFNVEVTPDNGEPFIVLATSRDVRAWERVQPLTANGRTMTWAHVERLGGMPAEAMYGIAYQAAKRAGKFNGTEDEFTATTDVDLVAMDAQPDPTSPGA
ncbi:hypothetical protein O7635_05355 [Asanoa sp. WMMD1127]|uniref:hypothetical protein n=1 Tax=Asanoa sp. WMMD1127 TaxID=3016107 RepID=UPI0024160985|nr:hypothetical protein [Asanoa sp. WMMD1127]MDG4821279.1 hypothetical protein [Asanoa sp. WMMD1127]